MEGWDRSAYGEAWADIYDEVWAGRFDVEASVGLLAGLPGKGPALELGVGTGRLALPLSERGIEVQGIDNSEAMVAKLRGKQGGEAVAVTIGDLADVPVEGSYPLVFVAFNTLFALSTQAEQVRCFRNVAEHLADGGDHQGHVSIHEKR